MSTNDERIAELDKLKTDNLWNEHPDYLREDWQVEAGMGNTQLGYWDWVLHRIEGEEDKT